MKKIKLDNVNDIIKDNKIVENHVAMYKYILECYIKNIFGGLIDFTLDSNYYLVLSENGFSIVLDEMAFFNPLAKLLGISCQNYLEDQKKAFIMGNVHSRLSALKKVKSEAELVYQFPAIDDAYKQRKQEIEDAINLESEFYLIKPTRVALMMKTKKLILNGSNLDKHARILASAQSFSLESFLSEYITSIEAEAIINNIDNIVAAINNMVLNEHNFKDIDRGKSVNYVKSRQG